MPLCKSKPEPQLGQSCWRLFIWLRKQERNPTHRLPWTLVLGNPIPQKREQRASKGCCSYLGDRASPGHHWKGSPALLLDPLECPVQAMMALVFQWHPLERTGGSRVHWLAASLQCSPTVRLPEPKVSPQAPALYPLFWHICSPLS